MTTIEPFLPLASNPARNAVPSIQGYGYQIWRSVEAWLRLNDNEVLYLECGEDFDRIGPDGATAVQVKSSPSTVTLASKDVINAIGNFWELVERNPDQHIRLHFLTRGNGGCERTRPFGNKSGFDVWSAAVSGSLHATEQLRIYLLNVEELSPSVRQFLMYASAEDVGERLLSRIVWCLGEPSVDFIADMVEEATIEFGLTQNIDPLVSLLAVDGFLAHCWKVAMYIDAPRRRLTSTLKRRVFQEKTSMPVQLTRQNLLVFSTIASDEALRRFRDEEATQMAIFPLPPAEYPMKPVPKIFDRAPDPDVIHDCDANSDVNQTADKNYDFAKARLRAMDLIVGWAEQFSHNLRNGERCIYHGHVQITVQRANSDERCEWSIWSHVTIETQWAYSKESGESLRINVRDSMNRVSSLEWRLNMTLKDGKFWTTSTLNNRVADFQFRSDNLYDREEFFAYTEVVAKLREGWGPVAFISRNVGEGALLEPVHPEPFSVDCKISEAQLEELQTRCDRMSLAYDFSDEHKVAFIFTPEFFSTALSQDDIREAFRDFVGNHGLAPYPETATGHVVLGVSGTRGIRLRLQRGDLRFETVRNRNAHVAGMRPFWQSV